MVMPHLYKNKLVSQKDLSLHWYTLHDHTEFYMFLGCKFPSCIWKKGGRKYLEQNELDSVEVIDLAYYQNQGSHSETWLLYKDSESQLQVCKAFLDYSYFLGGEKSEVDLNLQNSPSSKRSIKVLDFLVHINALAKLNSEKIGTRKRRLYDFK